MVSAQGIYLVSISVSILQLAQATYSSSQAAQNNSTPTYACLYVALALGIFATSTCCLDAARMASKIDEDAFRRGIYAQADTIFRITVQFGIVRQSRVTRASDVPKYRLCHMSQSLLTKG